jgi:hypothetical protein
MEGVVAAQLPQEAKPQNAKSPKRSRLTAPTKPDAQYLRELLQLWEDAS